MNEKQIKKVIKNSRLETSEVFVDNLMTSVEKIQAAKKNNSWWSFKVVLIVCSILTLLITFLLFKFLNYNVGFTSSISAYKTPVFIICTLILLNYINGILKLNKSLAH